jgi:TonB-dependent SusC/RagA subfamily outer membrane receptor
MVQFSNLFNGKIVAMIAITTVCVVGAVNAQAEPNTQCSKQTTNTPLVVVDGKEGDIKSISPESIESITILKNQSAVEAYGEKGKNGVMVVITKLNQSGKNDAPLFVVDGKEGGNIKGISPESIESITVLKDQPAIEMYGEKGKNGVIIITTKK